MERDVLTWRAPTVEDVDGVAALAQRYASRIHGRGAIENRNYLLNAWYGPEQEPSQSLEGRHLLALAPDGTAVAYLETDEEPEDGFFWFDCMVDPDLLSEALYAALRRQAEAWGSKWAARRRTGEYRIISQAWAQDVAKQRHLEAAGYERVRTYYRMEIELDALPVAPVVANGFTVRPYRPGEDDRKIYAAWREAMASDWGTTTGLTFDEFMFYKVSRESEQDLSLWHFAMDGEEIAGFTIARWERAGEPEAGHIRDVGVRRPYRRKGLALALLHATFREFYRQGKRRVSLGVDGMNANGAVQLYERAGMAPVLTQYKYGKPLTSPSDEGGREQITELTDSVNRENLP